MMSLTTMKSRVAVSLDRLLKYREKRYGKLRFRISGTSREENSVHRQNMTSSQHDMRLFVFNGGKLAPITGQFMKKPHISCVLETQTMPSGSIPAGGDGNPERAVSALGFSISVAPFGDFWSSNVQECTVSCCITRSLRQVYHHWKQKNMHTMQRRWQILVVYRVVDKYWFFLTKKV